MCNCGKFCYAISCAITEGSAMISNVIMLRSDVLFFSITERSAVLQYFFCDSEKVHYSVSRACKRTHQ
jgi:hypothetical protein